MAIFPPQTRIWWNEPVATAELVWIAVAFLWGLLMFFMMIYWHIYGKQNLSPVVGRIDPAVFEQRPASLAVHDDRAVYIRRTTGWYGGFQLW